MSGRNPFQTVLSTAWVVIPLALSAIVYFPILRNYFVAGDFHNFYLFLNHGLAEFLLSPHGGHLLVTRNLIWWLLYQLAGMRAEVYFATVLVTHLTTVALLFFVARRLTGSPRAACVVASLWGSTPVQEGTLGWYSVYGQAFVTLLLAWWLLQLARASTESAVLGRRALLTWTLVWLAAATSFGVGISIAIVSPLVGYLLLPASNARRRVVSWLSVLALTLPVLYWGMLQFYERVYAHTKEISIVYGGLRLPLIVLDLLVHLTADGVVALHASVFASRVELSTLASYFVAGGYLLILLAYSVRTSARERRLLAAGLVLCLGCYGIIALGRAPFCVNGPVAAVAHAPRYHYTATLPLALLTAVMLARIGAAIGAARMKDLAVLAFAVGSLLTQLRWGPAIRHYEYSRRETNQTVAAIQAAIDAAPPGTDVYIENRPFASIGVMLQRRLDLFPGWAGVFVIFFPDNVVDGRRVYFVSSPDVIAATQHGVRTSGLLVNAAARQ